MTALLGATEALPSCACCAPLAHTRLRLVLHLACRALLGPLRVARGHQTVRAVLQGPTLAPMGPAAAATVRQEPSQQAPALLHASCAAPARMPAAQDWPCAQVVPLDSMLWRLARVSARVVLQVPTRATRDQLAATTALRERIQARLERSRV